MDEKTIYLTFDDGPSRNTRRYLDLLDAYGCQATFFILGEKIAGHENDIRRMHEAGHKVAVHGFSHDYDVVYQSCESFWKDNLRARARLQKILGFETDLMRFQGGSSNTISRKYCPGIMTLLTEQAANYGYRYFDWNIDPGDSTRQYSVDEMYEQVMEAMRWKRKMPPVILLHDQCNLDSSVVLTEKLLQTYIAEGYRFECLDNDTPVVQHGVNN